MSSNDAKSSNAEVSPSNVSPLPVPLERATAAGLNSYDPIEADDSKSLDDPSYYINRELSHLSFNQRVLAQATSHHHPLLERLKFLLIFSSNLDEFFEIRVAGLMQSIKFERETTGPDGMHASDVLRQISKTCHEVVDQQYKILNDILIPELETQNIHFLRRGQWTPEQEEWIEAYIDNEVLPIISPIGIDPAHPFPRLVNKSLNFILELEGNDAFGRDLTS